MWSHQTLPRPPLPQTLLLTVTARTVRVTPTPPATLTTPPAALAQTQMLNIRRRRPSERRRKRRAPSADPQQRSDPTGDKKTEDGTKAAAARSVKILMSVIEQLLVRGGRTSHPQDENVREMTLQFHEKEQERTLLI